MLWPDTFNNHFHTDVGVACVEAIEAAGWQVVMPEGHVCCGRPLYDYGFLDLAERYLRNTIAVLRDEIRQGTPIVGMEPSCLAVFKDELTGMLPHDDDAARLPRNAMHFAEFFERYEIPVPRLAPQSNRVGPLPPQGDRRHGPRAQRSLQRMGVEVEPINGGCCGLAGSWGFEQGHHDISMQCGEQALLPAVREADRGDAGDRQRLLLQDPDPAVRHRPHGAPRRSGDQAGPGAGAGRRPARGRGAVLRSRPSGRSGGVESRAGGGRRGGALRHRSRRSLHRGVTEVLR